jgi:hypothetical protein
MLILSLATSHPVSTEIEIKNTTSSKLNILVFYFDRNLSDAEADIENKNDLLIGESIKIEHSRHNIPDRPSEIISKIIINNKTTGLEKEFGFDDFFDLNTHEEKLFKLIRKGRGGFFTNKEEQTSYYIWEIKDVDLE